MNGAEFFAWRTRLLITQEQAARLLGVSPRTVQNYDYDDKLPRYIALACWAIEHGPKEWRQPPSRSRRATAD